MQYNLVKNASFDYSIKDSTGLYRILDNDEFSYLIDEDFGPTNVVKITNDETIHLVANFGRRIKIDGFRLYMHSATVSGITASGIILNNIDFYYKNYEEDSYTVLNTKYVGDANFYYAELPFPSAPCMTQITISGVIGDIAEYYISNDNYSVAFGEEGTLQKKYIVAQEDTTNWETQPLAIYNNGTNSVQEYISAIICIDYTDNSADNYLKISSEEDGTYVGIEDGVLIENNVLTSSYIWNMGKFSNTHVVGNKIVLEDVENLNDYYKLGKRPYDRINLGDSNFVLDELNTVMYVLFNDYFLYLYKYFYGTDSWERVGKINPGCTGFENYANISYINGYAYILYNNNPDSFGRYEIEGVENNWEALPDLNTPTFTKNHRFNIIADGEEYVYGIVFLSNNGPREINSAEQWFARYSTISGSVVGWEELSNQYYSEYANYNMTGMTCKMVYNKDENCIYYINGYSGSGIYIQRYNISTNSWDDYINFSEEIGFYYLGDNFSYSYHNDYLYFVFESYDIVKKYNLNTLNLSTVVNLDMGYSNYMNPPQIIVTESLYYSNVDVQVFLAISGKTYADRDNMYCYNGAGNVGYYNTPIFNVSNGYASSYFLVDSTLTPYTNIKHDLLDGQQTVQVKSSDYPPLQYDCVYINVDTNLDRYYLYNDTFTEDVLEGGNPYYNLQTSAIDNNTGKIVVAENMVNNKYEIRMYNYDGSLAVSKSDDEEDNYRYIFDSMKFDSKGGFWAYGYTNSTYVLWHFNSSINVVASLKGDDYGIYSSSGQKLFVSDYCKGEDGSVWYTHEGYEKLIHLDEFGNELWSKTINGPTIVASDNDGGVWVVDNNNKDISRYSKEHEKIITFSLSNSVSMLVSDLTDGLWFTYGSSIHYINSNGDGIFNIDVGTPYNISGGHGVCVVYNKNERKVYYVNPIDGVTNIIDIAVSPILSPLFFSHNDEDMRRGKTGYLPVNYDPHWGDNGDLEWVTITKDGYFLPKNKYHQLRISLRAKDVNTTPSVNKILMAPSIRISDIKKGEYKNMYLKSEVPVYERNQTYNTKLKCWWEDKE